MERIVSYAEIAQHKFEAFYRCTITSNRIGAHTDTGHTVPYGTALWGVALSQALRARLRSYRPSGTFRNRHWLAFTKTCGSATCARNWRLALDPWIW